MTIQEIFDYLNTLTDNSFDVISEIIAWLNEAQNIVARWHGIQADPVTYELTTNQITLPVDLLVVDHLEYEDQPFGLIGKPWKGVLKLPAEYTSGTLVLYYFKRPDKLLATTPNQVPEVDEQYHMAMAEYVASMYFLADDDPEQRAAFRQEFAINIQSMKMDENPVTNFYNI